MTEPRSLRGFACGVTAAGGAAVGHLGDDAEKGD
jgi:hypothetical protein